MTKLSHIAINADDVPVSRAFYRATFGWQFSNKFADGTAFTATNYGGTEVFVNTTKDLTVDAIYERDTVAGGYVIGRPFTGAGGVR